MNLVESLPATTKDGSKLMKSYINAARRMEAMGVTLPEANETRVNPYSGAEMVLSPRQLAIYDFIIESYHNYMRSIALGRPGFSYRGHAFPVSVYDNARYLFMALWPEEYYAMID